MDKSIDIDSKTDIWYRIYNSIDNIWKELEQIAIQGVIDGGVKAMAFYRNAWGNIDNLDSLKKNPSTNADLEATAAILRSIDPLLKQISSKLDRPKVSYLGEETVYKDLIKKEIFAKSFGKIEEGEAFFRDSNNKIKIIIDAIDGTLNFSRGFPFFCSALAIFIEDQLRVSAIYDPVHHVVYSGLLSGPKNRPQESKSAYAWHVSIGDREILHDNTTLRGPDNKPAIAMHLPRSDETLRKNFICPSQAENSILERLAKNFNSIYALNSGLFAMAEVARNAIDGFVNIITNHWDIAAGEILIKACDGKVTNFDGSEIDYTSGEKSSVIAAHSKTHAKILEILCNKK